MVLMPAAQMAGLVADHRVELVNGQHLAESVGYDDLRVRSGHGVSHGNRRRNGHVLDAFADLVDPEPRFDRGHGSGPGDVSSRAPSSGDRPDEGERAEPAGHSSTRSDRPEQSVADVSSLVDVERPEHCRGGPDEEPELQHRQPSHPAPGDRPAPLDRIELHQAVPERSREG